MPYEKPTRTTGSTSSTSTTTRSRSTSEAQRGRTYVAHHHQQQHRQARTTAAIDIDTPIPTAEESSPTLEYPPASEGSEGRARIMSEEESKNNNKAATATTKLKVSAKEFVPSVSFDFFFGVVSEFCFVTFFFAYLYIHIYMSAGCHAG